MNNDVRELLKERKVRQWKVAEYLGINEFSFSRMLRKEVDMETKLRIYEAVEALSKGDPINADS